MRAHAALLFACLSSCAPPPAFAQERERQSPRVCRDISDPDGFIKAAATKSAAMTIVRAEEFGKASGYGDVATIAAVFIMPDEDTLVLVGRNPSGFRECFTSVHEDGATWEAVQKFFGRRA